MSLSNFWDYLRKREGSINIYVMSHYGKLLSEQNHKARNFNAIQFNTFILPGYHIQ